MANIAPNCNPEVCVKKRDLKNFKVVMVRHGQSEWNEQNIFTGWYDSKLTKRGEEEAVRSGKALRQFGYKFDIAYCSVLSRAIDTLCIITKEICQPELKVEKTWRLNERHYGSLTGLNKTETAEKYGEEQVMIWRRSYDVPPPVMEDNHPYYEEIVLDPRYSTGPPPNEFPKFESLKLTIERTLPYWEQTIVPSIKAGKKVLIVAHGNSLRGIVKHLDNMTDEEIMNINLPTGIPFFYELDIDLRPVPDGSMKFLGDKETVRQAIEEVKSQGKKK